MPDRALNYPEDCGRLFKMPRSASLRPELIRYFTTARPRESSQVECIVDVDLSLDMHDLTPLYPALVLLRMPLIPESAGDLPTGRDFSGSGFLVREDGVIVTAAHNLTHADGDEPTPLGKPLPWVWVCLYDAATEGWTDIRKVDVSPLLIDKRNDAAVLCLIDIQNALALPVMEDWEPPDGIFVVGFQELDKRVQETRPDKRQFEPVRMICEIPKFDPVDHYDRTASEHEFALRLKPKKNSKLLNHGCSGGPVLVWSRTSGISVLAIMKAMSMEPLDDSLPPQPIAKTTPLIWLKYSLYQHLFPRNPSEWISFWVMFMLIMVGIVFSLCIILGAG